MQRHGKCKCNCSTCMRLKQTDTGKMGQLRVCMSTKSSEISTSIFRHEPGIPDRKQSEGNERTNILSAKTPTEHVDYGNDYRHTYDSTFNIYEDPPCFSLSFPTESYCQNPFGTENPLTTQPMITEDKEPQYMGNISTTPIHPLQTECEYDGHFIMQTPQDADSLPTNSKENAHNAVVVGTIPDRHGSSYGSISVASRPDVDGRTTTTLPAKRARMAMDKLPGIVSPTAVRERTIRELIKLKLKDQTCPAKWNGLAIMDYTDIYVQTCLADFYIHRFKVDYSFLQKHTIGKKRPSLKRTYDYWDPFKKCISSFEYFHEVLLVYVFLDIMDADLYPLSAFRIREKQRMVISKTGFERIKNTSMVNLLAVKNAKYQIACHEDKFEVIQLPHVYGCKAMTREQYNMKKTFLEENPQYLQKNMSPGEFEQICTIWYKTKFPSQSKHDEPVSDETISE